MQSLKSQGGYPAAAGADDSARHNGLRDPG